MQTWTELGLKKSTERKMTLPDERYKALVNGYNLLTDLIDPKITPKVPKEVRMRAHAVLRHYPWPMHLEKLPEALPEDFSR